MNRKAEGGEAAVEAKERATIIVNKPQVHSVVVGEIGEQDVAHTGPGKGIRKEKGSAHLSLPWLVL